MKNDYLATGFAHVDGCDDTELFTDCLNLLDSLPYFQWYKTDTYRRLDLMAGLSVLDVGCGLGDDARRIRELVAPNGHVTGIDSSTVMIAKAGNRVDRSVGNLSFTVCDARALPFAPGVFDRGRIDRTLQHVAEPEAAVREIWRVMKPGGLVVAYDNDWGSFSISSENQRITSSIQDEWCYSFTNPWIGRHLGIFFKRAGFTDISVHPSVSMINDFDTADKVYCLTKTADRLVAMSKLAVSDAEEWIHELLSQSENGTFRAALTAYLIAGRKPL